MTLRWNPCRVKAEGGTVEGSAPELLLRIGVAAMEAVHPRALLAGVVAPSPHGRLRLRHGPVEVDLPYRRLFAIALGKAAISMAEAVADTLPGPYVGLGVAPEGAVSTLPGWQWWQGDHPLPTWRSVHAAAAIRSALAGAGRGDLVVVLLSGGASSLAVMPNRDSCLGEIRAVTERLLRSGAPIQCLNALRRERDLLKAGGLARWAAPAQVVGLVLSDVPGNALWAIGSGPTTAANPATSVEDTVNGGSRTGIFHQRRWPYPAPVNLIIGSNETALAAAARIATADGFPVEVRPNALHGEAREVGQRLAQEAQARAARAERVCIILGGETTVTVRGRGVGGRNTELALAFALHIAGVPGISCLTLATDGRDGVGPAAGALVNADTVHAAQDRGGDPQRALEDNDSSTFLSLTGATITTGPTGTNVADIAVILIDCRER